MALVFRLFISSTFSDFAKEREVLQTKVFPAIKAYCAERKATFQPIDLRWGVSNEAQLDQKTLELCLNEVRTCKTHPHPNFLIMLGDRYGWVPLPYAIEKTIFETLFSFIKEADKPLVSSWYHLDENAIPASYILKERSGDYEAYDSWKKVEETLRPILQHAVLDAKLSEEDKRSFFLSATEAEVEEGIIPYRSQTEFQQTLLEKAPHLKEVDTQYIFGFFRDMDAVTKQDDTFIVDEIDYNNAQAFKARVQTYLNDEKATLHIKTKQIDAETLDTAYLETFENRMVSFLQEKVDEFLEKQQESVSTPLQEENASQALYHSQKLKGFMQTPELGTLLSHIKSYTTTKESSSALIFYGPSGRGKSSLMAQAIEACKQGSSRVLYRYVGATPNATSAKSIWLSFFEELGIDLRSDAEKRRATEEEKSLHVNQNDETYEQFSQRLHNAILELKEPVAFFIDAIDQIGQDEPFIWLPYTLPSHIKLIISTLEDANYAKDSAYLTTLKTKSNLLYELPPFTKPEALLTDLLNTEARKVTPEQMNYFLTQYEHAQTPLFITIAAQEMKHWKSTQTTYDLETSNKGIIKEYIHNLSKLYHHHQAFVTKLLCYLVASKQGLSESEILTLLSTDKAFIQEVAPETYHKNLTQELPLVHWSRIQTQLKPFFKQQSLDNEELLSFFHREFIDAISQLPHYKQEHERAIADTQAIIQEVQEKDFNSNRWGKLYATLVLEYYLRYKDTEKHKSYSTFISQLDNEMWITKYYKYLNTTYEFHTKRNHMDKVITIGEHLLAIAKPLYAKNSMYWTEYYTIALNNLATSYYNTNRIPETIALQEESRDILKALYTQNPHRGAGSYTLALNNLAFYYQNINRIIEAITLQEEVLHIRRAFYVQNPTHLADDYTIALNNLASSYKDINRTLEAITLQEESLAIRKTLYDQNPNLWAEAYTIALNNLALSYKNINRTLEAITLEKESCDILKALYTKDPDCWAENYTRSLNNLALSYSNHNRISEAIKLEEETHGILKSLYAQNSERWAEKYTTALINLALSYSKTNRISEASKLQEETFSIQKVLYTQNPNRWVNLYISALHGFALSYINSNRIPEASNLQEEVLDIIKPLYGQTPQRWAENYTQSLINLASSYSKINRVPEAIKLEEEALGILKALYIKDPDRWAEYFSTALTNLAFSYKNCDRVSEAIKLEEEALGVLKALYIKDRDRWAELYIIALSTFAISYKTCNQTLKAISLEEECRDILKALYIKNPDRWEKYYTSALNNLAYSYADSNRISEAIVLEEESLGIRKVLYVQNPECWAGDYINALSSLAGFYYNSNRVPEAIALEEESLDILKVLYGKDSKRWLEGYITALNNLALFYYNTNRMSDTSLLMEEAFKISDYHFGASHPQTQQFKKNYEAIKQHVAYTDTPTFEDQPKSKYDQPFTTLLYLAKGIAMNNDDKSIGMGHLYYSLQFVRLSSDALIVFEALFKEHMKKLKTIENEGQGWVGFAKSGPKLPFDEAMKKLVEELQNHFGDDLICSFH